MRETDSQAAAQHVIPHPGPPPRSSLCRDPAELEISPALSLSGRSLVKYQNNYLETFQDVTLPCNPPNLDGFMSSNFNSINEMKNILSKVKIFLCI